MKLRVSFHGEPGAGEGRARLHARAPFFALATGISNENAAGVGPYALALDEVDATVGQLDRRLGTGAVSPRAREQAMVEALAGASRRIDALHAGEAGRFHRFGAHVLVICVADPWLAIAHAGGGYVYRVRGGRVERLAEPLTLGRVLEREGRRLAEGPGALLGDPWEMVVSGVGLSAGTPEIEAATHRLEPGDLVIALSLGATRQAGRQAEVLAAACAEHAAELASWTARALLDPGNREGVQVLALEVVAR